MTLISACGRLVEHKHVAEAGMKWFSKEYLGILAATSGLANDSKHTFVRALFTQPSDLFRSWGKTSSQTCKPWGKGYWTCLFSGHYWSAFLTGSVLGTKPHPQLLAEQTRLNLRAVIWLSSGRWRCLTCSECRSSGSPPRLTFAAYLWQLVVPRSPCLFPYQGRETALHSQLCCNLLFWLYSAMEFINTSLLFTPEICFQKFLL